MGAGAIVLDNEEQINEETPLVKQREMLTGKKGEMVRAFGNANDEFKCRVYDKVYMKHEEPMLDSTSFGKLTDEEKVSWANELVEAGLCVASDLRDAEIERQKMLKRGTKEENMEAREEVVVQHYKADVATKIAKLGEEEIDDETKVKCLTSCRDMIVSAHICATRLQSIMQGRKDRKNASKKKKGKKKK